MAQVTVSSCCLQGFVWDGIPQGEETKLGANPAYVVGPQDSDAAILVVHDLFGWKFQNIRLLADYYSKHIGARVWVPDFFGGEVLDEKIIMSGDWSSLDMPSFISRNSKEKRRDEIFACARELGKQHARVGAIGFCFGGWAVLELGAAEYNSGGKDGPTNAESPNEKRTKAGHGLVDCIATAHPSWVTREELDAIGVPIQIQAPEIDPVFNPELKEHAQKVIPTLGVPYEYIHFPGVAHAFATRGDTVDPKSKKAMRRSMECAVAWFKFWLKDDDDQSSTGAEKATP